MKLFVYNNRAVEIKYRGVEQLVARRAHNPKVVGSSPASATKMKHSPLWWVFRFIYRV